MNLTGDVTSVDLSPYLDNTDRQTLTAQSVDANTRSITIAGGNTANVDVRDADASVTNEIQDLSLVGNTLSLSSDATPVSLTPYLDNTDNQDLTLTGNTLSLTNDATSINLASYLDNTDNQDLTLTGNALALTNDASPINLAPYLQTLSYAGTTNSLSISGGNNCLGRRSHHQSVTTTAIDTIAIIHGCHANGSGDGAGSGPVTPRSWPRSSSTLCIIAGVPVRGRSE